MFEELKKKINCDDEFLHVIKKRKQEINFCVSLSFMMNNFVEQ